MPRANDKSLINVNVNINYEIKYENFITFIFALLLNGD